MFLIDPKVRAKPYSHVISRSKLLLRLSRRPGANPELGRSLEQPVIPPAGSGWFPITDGWPFLDSKTRPRSTQPASIGE